MSEGSAFKISLTASILEGFPSPLQFQETRFIIHLRGGLGPPLEGLGLVFLPIDISIVDCLPCILRLSASSSLFSLQDFLPSFFEGRS
jgi:hypothetical protein